jgi:CO dehydrogenase/acetyl-CoA synthase alpha subunit
MFIRKKLARYKSSFEAGKLFKCENCIASSLAALACVDIVTVFR